jgi:hypothetical protein
MNEAGYKQRLVDHLRKDVKIGVVLRHEDRFVKGHPDISITYGGHTAWVEYKVCETEDWRDWRSWMDNLPQLETLFQLEAHGRAFYFVYCTRAKKLVILSPGVVRDAVRAGRKKVYPCLDCFDGQGLDDMDDFLRRLSCNI